ncbi:Ternary complex factor MIP1 [Senna tora]|uniref:Ternary complex factor MIP1 n=1 Tax=Senna tora TaxID=362788 RepID=A0A834WCJ4_9FABA|nr:Ternary complex factor MIP1 [Senna tora]
MIVLPEDWQGKENQSCTNSFKRSKQSSCKVQTTRTPIKKLPTDNKSVQKRCNPHKRQQELRVNDQLIAEVRNPLPQEKPRGDDSPNIISENILKCLSTILMRMSSVKNAGPADDMPSLSAPKFLNSEGTEFWDPYGICLEFGKTDIGPYSELCAVEAKSFNPKRTANSLILLRRLKILLGKLATVNLENLNHQEKLAFWINVYNSCMMKAFIENGIPESPEMVVALMRKVRVYTASEVENQLEVAKREYLQAAIGISTSKFAIPKLLDWYLLDFAKDLESLLDWICLQLPCDVRKEALNFLEKRKTQPFSQFVQIIPYDFSFRYLLCT